MLFVRLGWRNLWRKPWRSAISIAAIASGLFFLILLLGISVGLKDQMLSNGTSLLQGHLQVHDSDYLPDRGLYDLIGDQDSIELEPLLQSFEAQSQVEAVSPRLYGFSLVSTGEQSAGAQLLGIDPVLEPRVTSFLEGLVAGKALSPDPRGQVLLGVALAKELRASTGDEIAAVTQAADGSLGNELYRVAGILKTGLSHLDRMLVVIHYRDLQQLLVLGSSSVHELAARIGQPELADTVVDELNQSGRLPAGAIAQGWGDLAPQLRDYVGLVDSFYGFLIGFISFFAALGILNTMLMAVFERTREFGMVGALGMTPRQILMTVLVETLVLVSLGIGLGLLVASLVMQPLSTHGIDLSRWMSELTMMNTRLDPVMRFGWDGKHLIWSVIGMVIAALLASLIPARKISRMDPVLALNGVGEGS